MPLQRFGSITLRILVKKRRQIKRESAASDYSFRYSAAVFSISHLRKGSGRARRHAPAPPAPARTPSPKPYRLRRYFIPSRAR